MPESASDITRLLWLLCAMLVFMMQIGFLLLETGHVRVRHMPGIAIKNFMMLLVSSLTFSLIGYKLMYGASVGGMFGWTIEIPEQHLEWLFYQTGFAAIASTIISGAIAERTTLRANLIASFAMAGLIYPIYGHWVWGTGWLSSHFQIHDFAGSGVVHYVGGLTAGIGAYITGPRRGWLNVETGEVNESFGTKSLPLASCGVIFLWIGWMGFNGGSASVTSLDGGTSVGKSILATCLAASTAGFSVYLLAAVVQQFQLKKIYKIGRLTSMRDRLLFDPFGVLSGAMGGMVAVTAVCDILDSYRMACLVGALAGMFVYVCSKVIKYHLKVDDPIDAIAVHAGGGAVGVMLAAGFSENVEWAGQLSSLAVATLWTSAIAYPLFRLLDRYHILRCLVRDEQIGLTFESRTLRPPEFPLRTRYLAQELKEDIRDFLFSTVAGPIHRLRTLKSRVRTKSRREIEDMIDNEIVSLTRMSQLKSEPVSLQIVVKETIKRNQQDSENHVINFSIKPKKKMDDLVAGQKDMVKDAVGALISNAINTVHRRYELTVDSDQFTIDFKLTDILDPPNLVLKLKKNNPFAEYLKRHFSVNTLDLLERYSVGPVDGNLQQSLIFELNGLLHRQSIYNSTAFEKISLTSITKSLLDEDLDKPFLLNRLLLGESFRNELRMIYSPEINCQINQLGFMTVLSVSDNGTGLPLEVRKRLFEPLHRKHMKEGHGLGLFHAEYIAETFNGYISLVKSTRVDGSIFQLVLWKWREDPRHNQS